MTTAFHEGIIQSLRHPETTERLTSCCSTYAGRFFDIFAAEGNDPNRTAVAELRRQVSRASTCRISASPVCACG